MSQFEFILIITSVIYAMAVAQILSGVGRLAQAEVPVRWYLPHTLWIVIVFVLLFLVWWSTWEFRTLDWTFPGYAYMIIAPTLLYFTASLLIPSRGFTKEIDLEAHFLRIRKPFLWSFLFATAAGVIDGTVLQDEPLWFPGRIGHLALLITVFAGLHATRKVTQTTIASLTLLALAYITLTRLWFPR